MQVRSVSLIEKIKKIFHFVKNKQTNFEVNFLFGFLKFMPVVNDKILYQKIFYMQVQWFVF